MPPGTEGARAVELNAIWRKFNDLCEGEENVDGGIGNVGTNIYKYLTMDRKF